MMDVHYCAKCDTHLRRSNPVEHMKVEHDHDEAFNGVLFGTYEDWDNCSITDAVYKT